MSARREVENTMNGTEWTEPGQGATVAELRSVIHGAIHAASITGTAHLTAAHDHVHRLANGKDARRRTNLRLTGKPLTAEDIQRIEEAE